MNERLRGRAIRDVFDGEEYQLLIVANKFQTGFDQPKLVAMYVDKQLSGVRPAAPCGGRSHRHP